jgi:hypothetical protein
MSVMQDEPKQAAPSLAELRSDGQPAWVTSELPDQYADIARQMAALKEQARAYEGVAGVLWQRGSALTSSVRDLFVALGFFETELAEYGAHCDLRVHLGNDKRLLVEVASEPQSLDRRSPHISRILQVLQEEAGERDRVVLVANVFPEVAPAERRMEPVTGDALRLIQGLGANLVPTSALFGLWKQSLQDPQRGKNSVMNLHAMDGGIFR